MLCVCVCVWCDLHDTLLLLFILFDSCNVGILKRVSQRRGTQRRDRGRVAVLYEANARFQSIGSRQR